MQNDDRPTEVPHVPGAEAARREILAILAESGLAPAQGVEALLDRLLPRPARR